MADGAIPKIPQIDEDESNYAKCRVEAVLPIRAHDFFEWYMDRPVEKIMLGTLMVSPIVKAQNIGCERYIRKGDLRKYTFKDGTIAWETIIDEAFPNGYTYLPFAYNNPVRLLSDHAKAQLRATPEGEHARIIWDYAFHARNKMALQPLKLFVSLDWKRNLANALKALDGLLTKDAERIAS